MRFGCREETAAEKNETYSSGAKSDGKHTYFRFTFAGKTYTGVLDGATKTEKNYAALLPAYLASFGERNAVTQSDYLKKMLLGEYSQTDAYRYSVKFGVKETPCFVLGDPLRKGLCRRGIAFKAVRRQKRGLYREIRR